MEKQYGIFRINTEARYLKDGLNQLTFLSERFLHETEQGAINFIPNKDGHYVIMPVYITTDDARFEEEMKRLDQFAKSIANHFKQKEGTMK